MATIAELIAQVEANGHEVWSDGPQAESAIAALEAKFGIRFPPSYRDFLAAYGGMGIYDSTISGIIDGNPLDISCGSLYGDTLRFQSDWDLPNHLLIIQADEDAPYCLDTQRTSKTGEWLVVCFKLHSRRTVDIATDFDDWMRRFYLHWADETE